MVDVDDYLSHPDKKLSVHINGVVAGVKKRTNSKIAELSAIFHDIGKLNPNFQEKLRTGKSNGYSNHAYLSAYLFLCYCTENHNDLLKQLNNEENWIASIISIIASHHKDLPDFPIILKEKELISLDKFLKTSMFIPASEFLMKFVECNNFNPYNEYKERLLYELPVKICKIAQKHIASETSKVSSLIFFLETQFSFASLIAADKEDASYFTSSSDMERFCSSFNKNLEFFISKFPNDTKLNIIRTQIREEAIINVSSLLNSGKRIFSLTSPTGSGKTVILLSLAGEILKSEGNYRIIYALPFLSITEQVEKICQIIFKDFNNSLARIDSKSENKLFELYQDEVDNNPETINKIVNMQFAEDTFDYPFIITTFVKIFETLLSNKNSTLLKLPNFSKAIFLIDEIQSLPPRLYGFFVAMLDAFCRKFDSYAIISTATMPNFELPSSNTHEPAKIFRDYTVPSELVSLDYFKSKIFNRYTIKFDKSRINIEGLTLSILAENCSVLVILNTIDDSKLLFNLLCEKAQDTVLILINTHFTPSHRKKKIQAAKWFLERNKKGISNKKIILVSTQLIEAGVDIDFPTVYRDIAPMPSIIQSAGRCNRNGIASQKGKVVIFELVRNEKSSASLIYRDKDKVLLSNTIKAMKESDSSEYQLLEIQKEYFNFTQQNLVFGLHQEIDLIEKIKEAAFEQIGKFQLIDKKNYGEEIQYYIPKNNDDRFEKLELLYIDLQSIAYKDYRNKRLKWIEIESLIRKMSDRIVQVRLKVNDVKPITDKDACFNIYKLSTSYDSIRGIDLSNINQII
ncbi:MAG: CRISPR-associated helicase Cas3' [Ignavibacteriaceae bacterium]|nr:CRISPR-associated helicase Cas3' [Ignavibacteriaceae bacterium]